jgi:hypothetical protein
MLEVDDEGEMNSYARELSVSATIRLRKKLDEYNVLKGQEQESTNPHLFHVSVPLHPSRPCSIYQRKNPPVRDFQKHYSHDVGSSTELEHGEVSDSQQMVMHENTVICRMFEISSGSFERCASCTYSDPRQEWAPLTRGVADPDAPGSQAVDGDCSGAG